MPTNPKIDEIAERLVQLSRTIRSGVDVQLSYDLTLTELANATYEHASKPVREALEKFQASDLGKYTRK